MTDMGPNCISSWLPKLEAAGVPVPQTRLVRTDLNLIHWLDGQTLEGEQAFLAELLDAIRAVGVESGGPAFLRGGEFSGKHAWRDTCFIEDATELTIERLRSQMATMIDVGESMNFFGFPWGVWAAREYLHPAPGDVAFEAEEFKGMPVRRELRVFVRDGRIQCYHPYWPQNAFRRATPEQLEAVKRLAEDVDGQRGAALTIAGRAGVALADGAVTPGDAYWSVDCLHTSKGWYVTDVALGDQSFHWPDCPSSDQEWPDERPWNSDDLLQPAD